MENEIAKQMQNSMTEQLHGGITPDFQCFSFFLFFYKDGYECISVLDVNNLDRDLVALLKCTVEAVETFEIDLLPSI